MLFAIILMLSVLCERRVFFNDGLEPGFLTDTVIDFRLADAVELALNIVTFISAGDLGSFKWVILYQIRGVNGLLREVIVSLGV